MSTVLSPEVHLCVHVGVWICSYVTLHAIGVFPLETIGSIIMVFVCNAGCVKVAHALTHVWVAVCRCIALELRVYETAFHTEFGFGVNFLLDIQKSSTLPF